MMSIVAPQTLYDQHNGQCWRATRRQVMSSYGCQVRYLWLADHVASPYLEGSLFLETGRGNKIESSTTLPTSRGYSGAHH